MKKLLLLSLVLLSIKSIGQKPLKGTYQITPYQIETTKPFDSVWSDLIDLFAQKGIDTKTIDKADGLIVSEKTSFLNSHTFENKKGKLIDTMAFVVTQKPSNRGDETTITGDWNVRVKKSGDKTIINVNLVNLISQEYTPGGSEMVMGTETSWESSTLNFEVKSTGVFERLVASIIK